MIKYPAFMRFVPRTAVFLTLLMHVGLANGQAALLLDDYPESYIVKEGDTLWNIASQFLADPLRWDEIWLADRFLDDPDSIVPGDTIRVENIAGILKVVALRSSVAVERISPQMRASLLTSTIPAIPLENISNILTSNRIVDEADYDTAPYIVSTLGSNLIIGTGDEVFARGVWAADSGSFRIYRQINRYKDPDNGDPMGVELITVGEATIVDNEGNDLKKLLITSSKSDIQIDDRLLIREATVIATTIYPEEPGNEVEGNIIALVDSETLASLFGSVLINLGSRDGMDVGTILSIQKPGGRITDATGRERKPLTDQIVDFVTNDKLQLPNREIGTLLVYKTFEKLSYGVILTITEPVGINDVVSNP